MSAGRPGDGPGPRRRVADRDRDPTGRPRNSRPRDAAGRPLPYGAPGVDRTDEPAPAPDEALDRAQELIDAGRPFDAHDLLEAVWKAAPEPERGLWRGLAQLAVGLTHLQRGNRRGAVALLRRGADGVAPYATDPPYGIAAGELADAARGLADTAAADEPAAAARGLADTAAAGELAAAARGLADTAAASSTGARLVLRRP